MAHKSIWFQGRKPFVVPKCDGKIPQTAPLSKTIAAEYQRGFRTFTNVIVPNIKYDDYGAETALKKELRDVKVGDYLWFVLVPPTHYVLDVFAYNDVVAVEHSHLNTMAGIQLELVTGKFKKADENGDFPMQEERSFGSLIMPDGDDPDKQFVRGEVNEFNGLDTWVGVGVKVNALPEGKTLADIVGKIAVGVHALDYQSQDMM